MSVAYPPATTAAARYRPPAAETAESLVLAGLILQAIGGVILLGGIGWLLGFSILNPFPHAWAVATVAVIVGVVVVVFLYLVYSLSYQRIRRGEYEAARSPTLVLGILSLVTGLLPGILYILGYSKLDDVLRAERAPPVWPPVGTSATGAQVACRTCGHVHPYGRYTFCPDCGQRLAT